MPKINRKHEPFFAVYHIYFIYNLQHIKKTEVGPDYFTDEHIYIQALKKIKFQNTRNAERFVLFY